MTADDPKVSDPDVGRTDGGERQPEDEGPEQTIERLTAQLTEKMEEADRYRDLHLRERAETENFKKRMQREKADALRFAVEPLARELLPVIDNLERAVGHAASGGNGQPLLEGVRMVLRSALEALERHGVTRLEARSGPFDPSRHEAVMQVPDARLQANQIVEQFEPGYSLHGRLLRPAKVSVSAKPVVEGEQNDD